MSNLTRRHGLALLAATALGPLALAVHAETLTGSGRVVSESRPVSGFEAITVEASFTVKVRQAGSDAVQVQADDNLLPYIETVLDTRRDRPTLVLRWKRSVNIRHSSDIVVTVDARTVRALSTSGSGLIEADTIQGERLALSVAGSGDVRVHQATVAELQASVAGSGDVRAAGRAAVLKVSIAGSGDVDLSGVEAEEVKVSIAGSGDAQVTAHQSLSVSIAGSGDVRYGGRVPSVKTSIVGSGDVRRR